MVRLASARNYGSNFTVQGFAAGPTPNAVHVQLRRARLPPHARHSSSVGAGVHGADTLGSPKVAMVNEAFAKKFNLGRDAVGKRMRRGRQGAGHRNRRPARNTNYSEVKGEVSPVVVFRTGRTKTSAATFLRAHHGSDES